MICPIMSGRQALTITSGKAGEKPKVMIKPVTVQCVESECAFWVAGEYQECSVKNSAFFIRMINKQSFNIVGAINNNTKYGG